ncbi:MAG: 8-oxo-dGTP diphosphatase [Clostridia bacterium]|nr:8-oxo-dGTP diphosphatase [Clostridia bacterium]
MNELTTMIMIENIDSDEVVVIERIKKYPGICFPGGHVEPGESFTSCAIREAREETGLSVKDPILCGIINWAKKDSDERYVEYLFKTSDYSGEIISGTEEGRVFWLKKSELNKSNLSQNFDFYLPVFFSEKPIELFGEWSDDFGTAPVKQ